MILEGKGGSFASGFSYDLDVEAVLPKDSHTIWTWRPFCLRIPRLRRRDDDRRRRTTTDDDDDDGETVCAPGAAVALGRGAPP